MFASLTRGDSRQNTCLRYLFPKRTAYMKLLSISGLLLLLTVAAASCARSSSTPTVLPATTLSPRPTITGVPELVREPPSTSTAMPEQTIAPETMTPTDLPTTPATTLPSRPTAEPTPVPSHTPTPASNFAPTSTPRPTPVPTPEPTRTPEPTPAPTTAPTPTPGPTLDQIPLPASVLAENIGSLSARIVGLRFFESPLTGVPRDQRVYARSFPRSTTRFLNWELALVFPTPGRQSDVVIDSVFLRNGGDILARQNTKVTHKRRLDIRLALRWHRLERPRAMGCWALPGGVVR